MNFFRWKEKQLKAVWRVERKGHTSWIAGTAHFCPYRFEKALIHLIKRVETVLFEGPLDEESMARVVEYGRKGEGTPSLYEALDPAAIKEINRQLGLKWSSNTAAGSYLDLIQPTTPNLLEAYTRGVRPWMAFFTVWAALLNWKYSMDVEAYRIALKLGKRVEFLETIDDQLAAMDGIPFERIVNYLNHIGHWKGYREVFLSAFLRGDLEKFVSMTGLFPTRCDSILAKRDPVFFRRVKVFFDEGPTTAFVGVAHISGIREMFLQQGDQITQETA